MTETPKPRIVMDVCRDGWTKGLQLGISALNADGGRGFRIAGPKYNGSQKRLLSTDLDERDAREIRKYLDEAFPPDTTALAAEVERLRDEHAKLIRSHCEDGHQLAEMLGTIGQLRARVAELEAPPADGVPRQEVRHTDIADACRRTPGEWRLIATYTYPSARQMATQVRHARIRAYAPAGAFEARAITDGRLYVRAAADGAPVDGGGQP